jgi:hypothetical protein
MIDQLQFAMLKLEAMLVAAAAALLEMSLISEAIRNAVGAILSNPRGN